MDHAYTGMTASPIILPGLQKADAGIEPWPNHTGDLWISEKLHVLRPGIAVAYMLTSGQKNLPNYTGQKLPRCSCTDWSKDVSCPLLPSRDTPSNALQAEHSAVPPQLEHRSSFFTLSLAGCTSQQILKNKNCDDDCGKDHTFGHVLW